MLQIFRSYQIAKSLYQESKNMPLRGEMRDQFERALLSVVLNLAEGSAKPTRKDQARFYAIALGSLREVQAIFDLIGDQYKFAQADRLAAMIFRLCHPR